MTRAREPGRPGEEDDDRAASERAQRRFADLFDVRRVIGGLFLLYGVGLFALGLFATQEDIDRAAGVNINLWGGLAMALFGAGFLAWALLRPVGRELAGPPEAPERAPGAGAPPAAPGPGAAPPPRGTEGRPHARPGALSSARSARRIQRRRGEQR